mmetsp:Transcript_4222/g.17871  ORF Transcript_4222/g.17871 Transcript_4222/m.17871 type:complete len:130 (-) Transcript_4222:3046-3435(-)
MHPGKKQFEQSSSQPVVFRELVSTLTRYSRVGQIDTTNILFICGGSFAGLETVIARRVEQNMAYNTRYAPRLEELLDQVESGVRAFEKGISFCFSWTNPKRHIGPRFVWNNPRARRSPAGYGQPEPFES